MPWHNASIRVYCRSSQLKHNVDLPFSSVSSATGWANQSCWNGSAQLHGAIPANNPKHAYCTYYCTVTELQFCLFASSQHQQFRVKGKAIAVCRFNVVKSSTVCSVAKGELYTVYNSNVFIFRLLSEQFGSFPLIKTVSSSFTVIWLTCKLALLFSLCILPL